MISKRFPKGVNFCILKSKRDGVPLELGEDFSVGVGKLQEWRAVG